jgi:hypothetical protein
MSALILLRATTLTRHSVEFANVLERESGFEVVHLLDGRHAVQQESRREKILLTETAVRALGLYAPPNFQWQCGDYGIYLARRAFPDVRHFWLIEHDIRFGGGPANDFFRCFERLDDIDLLACQFEPVQGFWTWGYTAMGRDIVPHRCLFGIVRLSSRAVDEVLAHRRKQSKLLRRRATWANDEGFVATTLANRGFTCRDLNSFGPVFYDESSLSLFSKIDGATFDPPRTGVRIYHPVLYGEDLVRGNTTSTIVVNRTLLERALRRYGKAVNPKTKW